MLGEQSGSSLFYEKNWLFLSWWPLTMFLFSWDNSLLPYRTAHLVVSLCGLNERLEIALYSTETKYALNKQLLTDWPSLSDIGYI